MFLINKIFCILLVFRCALCISVPEQSFHSFNGSLTQVSTNPSVTNVAVYNCKDRYGTYCELSDIYLEEDESAFKPGSKQIRTLTTLKITDSNIPVLNMQYVCQVAYNLFYIELKNIRIKEISKGAFNGCTYLFSINLSNNQIKELSADTFGQNKLLRNINLSGNLLKSLPTDIFKGLVSLEYLYLSSNEITSLDNIDFIQNYYLRVLYLSHNPLKSINLNLHAQYLETLGIQDTDISCSNLKDLMKKLKKNYVNLDTKNDNPRTRDNEPNWIEGVMCLSQKKLLCEENILTLLSGISARLDSLDKKMDEMLELKERVNHLEEHLQPSSTEPTVGKEEIYEEEQSYHESNEYEIIDDHL